MPSLFANPLQTPCPRSPVQQGVLGDYILLECSCFACFEGRGHDGMLGVERVQGTCQSTVGVYLTLGARRVCAHTRPRYTHRRRHVE